MMALEGQAFGSSAVGPPLAIRAGFWVRLVAVLIDGFIVGIASGILMGIAALAGARAVNLMQALVTLAAVVYYVYFWHVYGATPGKMALGLRIVNDRDENPTVGQAIGRYFAEILSALPFFLGYFWVFGEQRRAWHDLLAGTYVVKR